MVINLINNSTDEDKVNSEMKQVFPSSSSQTTPSHEDVISKANRLLTSLHSDPSSVSGRHSKKRKRHRAAVGERGYQKNLVMIEFPGNSPPDVQVLHDYDKLYEGSLTFSSSMTEEEIRERIANLVRKKQSLFNNYEAISDDDFEFVRCVNKRVKVPDGEIVYNGSGVRQLFPSGAVYVRLTKSFAKTKVNNHARTSV